MKNCFLLFALLLSILSNAQSLFTRTYGSPGEFNQSNAVAQSADSNYVFFGSTSGWGAVNGDMVLVKTDTLGTTIWEHIYGNSASEKGISVKALSDKGFILTGITNENSEGDYDIRVIRTDSMGNPVWTKTYGSPFWDIVEDITALADGGFAIAATSYNEPYTTGTFYLLKLDTDGNLVWDNYLNRGQSNFARGIAELPDGSLLIGGQGTQSNHSDTDMLLVKYSSTGDTLWSNYYGTDTLNETVADIAYSADLRICLAGNRTQIEGNTREYLVTVDVDGLILNVNDFVSPRHIEVQSVDYFPGNNSFVFSVNYTDQSITRATFYRFTVLLDYLCNASANDLANSFATEAIATRDGYMLMTGTYNSLAPGISSIFLMKAAMNCTYDNTVQLSIQDQIEWEHSSIFPNPSEGIFHIQTEAKPKEIEVRDMQGRLMNVLLTYSEGMITIEIPDAESGVYLIRLISKDGKSVINHRILINR